jgi:hypothetical protein
MGNLKFQVDDFGYNNKTDQKIIKLMENKKIISISVLPNFIEQKGEQIINIIKNKKIASHINLIEGKPISSPSNVKTLVDKNGYFYPLPKFIIRLFVGLIETEDIIKEINAQISILKRLGVNINELNSHQHTQALSPIAEIFINIARRNKIKIIRSYKNIYTGTLRGRIYHLILKACALLSYIIFYKKLGLPKTWKLANNEKICFMSWEGKIFSFDMLFHSSDRFHIVIHPELGFDKNIDYLRFLNKPYGINK